MTYFYPRPPRGGRLRWLFPSPRSSYFYPRPPRGGRLMRMYILSSSSVFLSTPSARRATCRLSARWCRLHYFYPRPPRGGRPALRDSCGLIRLISIHALREEGDRSPWKSLTFPRYFYPRPPRGGRLLEFCQCLRCFGISIHALREEGDRLWCEGGDLNPTFLSTPSARRATRPAINPRSISGDFYPRPPRGGRLATMTQCWQTWVFLSTPSARRATSGG